MQGICIGYRAYAVSLRLLISEAGSCFFSNLGARIVRRLRNMIVHFVIKYQHRYTSSFMCLYNIASRKAGNVQSWTIGGEILHVVTSFSYLGHIICNDLSDDADLKAKARQMYANIKTLRQKFHMCSTVVKVKLFTAYFSNVYMCVLWVNYRKTKFHQFMVAYNNSNRMLNRLPMRCSASDMLATDTVNYCTCVMRKSNETFH